MCSSLNKIKGVEFRERKGMLSNMTKLYCDTRLPLKSSHVGVATITTSLLLSFLKEINTFIQRRMLLHLSKQKITVILISNKCCAFELYIYQRILSEELMTEFIFSVNYPLKPFLSIIRLWHLLSRAWNHLIIIHKPTQVYAVKHSHNINCNSCIRACVLLKSCDSLARMSE